MRVLLGCGRHGQGQTFCFIAHESIDLGHGTIESHDGELLVICDVQEKILAHDSQTNEAEITTGRDPRRSADIDAGQTGAIVSLGLIIMVQRCQRAFRLVCILTYEDQYGHVGLLVYVSGGSGAGGINGGD